MKDVFESFIAIRNLALMNCLIRMNLSLFTVKIFKKIDIKMFKVLNGENPPVEMKFFVSGMKPLMTSTKVVFSYPFS